MAKSAYEKVYESLKKSIQKTDISTFENEFAFQFNVTGDAAGIFYVEYKKGYSKLAVENFSYDDHTAVFIADAATFTALVEGTLDPAKAIKSGKLTVEDNVDGCADIFNAIAPKKAAKKTAAKEEAKPAAKKAEAKEDAKPAAKKTAAKKPAAKKTEAPAAAVKAEEKTAAPAAAKADAPKKPGRKPAAKK